jgi:hypothetical protein
MVFTIKSNLSAAERFRPWFRLFEGQGEPTAEESANNAPQK